jgi:hypothetical protein
MTFLKKRNNNKNSTKTASTNRHDVLMQKELVLHHIYHISLGDLRRRDGRIPGRSSFLKEKQNGKEQVETDYSRVQRSTRK